MACALAQLIGVTYTIEQPVGSYMPRLNEMRLLFLLSALTAYRTVTWLGAFSSEAPKPIWLLGNAPWAPQLRRHRPKLNAQHRTVKWKV
jgi:hypothetical protein